MNSFEALKIISEHRGKAVVIAATTGGREWGQLSTNKDLDIPFQLALGKASSVGLGMALARPETRVFVFDGDGGLVSNLGTMITINNISPPNLIHFVFENRIYRTTGGQPIPCAGKVSYANIAREAGYAHVYDLAELEDLKKNIEAIVSQPGPTFVCLKFPPVTALTGFLYPKLGKTKDIIARINNVLGKVS